LGSIITATKDKRKKMISLDDKRWSGLSGGYRIPYDPRNALRSLATGIAVEAAWTELWNELHHQGDVGDASYAAVPELVRIHAERNVLDWNTYGLVAIIEVSRQNAHNPKLPSWLEDSYHQALQQLANLGLDDFRRASQLELVTSIISILALAKGQPSLGNLAINFDENERRELLVKAGRLSN
jgi:hypothetical protein